jgi:hypothetical protein
VGLDCKYCREAAFGRAVGNIAGWYLRLLGHFVRALIGSARNSTQRRALLLLLLLMASLVLLATAIPKPWVSNSPIMFLLAGFLLVLLQGPLRGLASPVQKLVKIGISACMLAGIAMFLDWRPLWVVLEPLGLTRNQTGFHLVLMAVCGWWISVFWIIFSRKRDLHTTRSLDSSSIHQTQHLARHF